MRPKGANTPPLPVGTLPLFAWVDAEAARLALPTPLAARRIARRFHIPTHTARLVAELAGYSSEGV